MVVGLVVATAFGSFSPAAAYASSTLETVSVGASAREASPNEVVSVAAVVKVAAPEGAAEDREVVPRALPFLVVKCLTGLGLKGPEIIRIVSSGSPGAVSAGLARAIVACLAMK